MAALLVGAACPLAAEVVTIPAAADTSLFEFDPDFNFGRQPTLPSGSIGSMAGADAERARALFRFDVAADIPPQATILSATMRLSISTRVPTRRASSTFQLHRVLVDWGEGDGRGEVPGGREAVAGEATWNNRRHPDVPWSEPGGVLGVDYASDPSAGAEGVNGNRVSATTYEFVFNQVGLSDLAHFTNGTQPNRGWMLRSLGEGTLRTARHWISKDPQDPPLAMDAGPLPELEVTYSIAAPVAPVLKSVEIDQELQELIVRMDGLAGHSYQLQCGDLVTWSAEGDARMPVQDGELIFRIPIGGESKFVRVEVTELP